MEVLLANLPYLLKGAVQTLWLILGSIPAGTLLGVLLGILSIRSPAWLRFPVMGWGFALRGIPVLVWMFIAYYTLPSFGVRLGDFTTITGALALYTAAFAMEITRAAILSVPKGQIDAAKSLGMRWRKTLSLVVLPQALKFSLPLLVNNCVMMVKFSAYASVVGVWELTYAARETVERTVAPVQIFFGVMMIYFAFCYPLSLVARYLERRFEVAH